MLYTLSLHDALPISDTEARGDLGAYSGSHFLYSLHNIRVPLFLQNANRARSCAGTGASSGGLEINISYACRLELPWSSGNIYLEVCDVFSRCENVCTLQRRRASAHRQRTGADLQADSAVGSLEIRQRAPHHPLFQFP